MIFTLTYSSGGIENNWPDYAPNNEGGDYVPNNEGGQYMENWSDDQDNTYNGRTLVWTLNPDTLDSMKATNSKLLVDFYQPWCKACVLFRPDYKKAAKISQDLGLGVVFAQINLQKYPELKEMLGIDTYPRILFWAKGFPGDKGPKRYFKKFGLEANRLIKWLQTRIELAASINDTQPCNNEFQCDDGLCVSYENVCDKYNHCRDGSDERFCDASFDDNEIDPFVPFTTSLPVTNPTIDDINDITTTEKSTSWCQRTEFSCASSDGSECIPYLKRCDGNADCSDGSDEENCSGTLTFCLLKLCVSQLFVKEK